MKKFFTPFLLTAMFFSVVVLLVWNLRYTVVEGERSDDLSRITYGYKIEQFYFWHSMRLTVWNKSGFTKSMNLVYELPGLTVEKVVEERWINSQAAIYLNLQLKYQDSAVSIQPTKIIYDFHRGEMYTSSVYTLWRIWDKQDRPEGWMSESEFDAVLLRLSS